MIILGLSSQEQTSGLCQHACTIGRQYPQCSEDGTISPGIAMVVRCHVGARNWAQALWKSRQCSAPSLTICSHSVISIHPSRSRPSVLPKPLLILQVDFIAPLIPQQNPAHATHMDLERSGYLYCLPQCAFVAETLIDRSQLILLKFLPQGNSELLHTVM